MTKDDFLKYINNTPENTNSAMLLQMLDEYEGNGGNVMRVTFTIGEEMLTSAREEGIMPAVTALTVVADKTLDEIIDFINNKKGYIYGIAQIKYPNGENVTIFLPFSHIEMRLVEPFGVINKGPCAVFNFPDITEGVQMHLNLMESGIEESDNMIIPQAEYVANPADSNVETLKASLTAVIQNLQNAGLMKGPAPT